MVDIDGLRAEVDLYKDWSKEQLMIRIGILETQNRALIVSNTRLAEDCKSYLGMLLKERTSVVEKREEKPFVPQTAQIRPTQNTNNNQVQNPGYR